MGKAIGIDFGTVNTTVSYIKNNTPCILPFYENEYIIPSLISIDRGQNIQIGKKAGTNISKSGSVFYQFKNLLGKSYREIESVLPELDYPIIQGEGDEILLSFDNQPISTEKLTSLFWKQIKDISQKYFHWEIEELFLSTPISSTPTQIQSMQKAGEMAGFKRITMVEEPVAACLAFYPDLSTDSHLVIFSQGATCLEISVAEIKNRKIRILAFKRLEGLGGLDIDMMMTRHIDDQIGSQFEAHQCRQNDLLKRILKEAEKAKIELSNKENCELIFPFLGQTVEGFFHYGIRISRQEFDHLLQKKMMQIGSLCQELLASAKLKKKDIDGIIPIGASTQIPLVQKTLIKIFDKELQKRLDPRQIVALGLAGKFILNGEMARVKCSKLASSLGIGTSGDRYVRLIEADTPLPIKRSIVFTTAQDEQEEVEIKIFQGEEDLIYKNKLLGSLNLPQIKTAKQGIPRIQVTFSIDTDCILKVQLTDLSTQQQNETTFLINPA